MATVVMHWDMLLLFIAGGLWTAQHGQRWQPWIGAVLVFGVGAGFLLAVAGARTPMPAVVAGLAFVVIGLLAATQLSRQPWLSLASGMAAALGSGLALGSAELDFIQRPVLFIAGLMVGAGIGMFYIVAVVTRLPEGWPWIGVRVLGSWIAAVGLIVCAYSWRLVG